MKNKLLLFISIFLFFAFQPENDKTFHTLTKQSRNIVMAKVTEVGRCVKREDGVEECTFSLKIIKVYKGKLIRAENTIRVTIIQYAILDDNRRQPAAGDDDILFLAKQNKRSPTEFKLADAWYGAYRYDESIDKWLSEHAGKNH